MQNTTTVSELAVDEWGTYSMRVPNFNNTVLDAGSSKLIHVRPHNSNRKSHFTRKYIDDRSCCGIKTQNEEKVKEILSTPIIRILVIDISTAYRKIFITFFNNIIIARCYQ